MTENTTLDSGEVEETFETDAEGVAYTSESDASADTPARPATIAPGAATGRRKEAVARVRIVPGTGQWTINGRSLDQHFPRPILQQSINRPLVVTETQGQFDVHVRVVGGGLHGQADAVRLGIARALLKIDEGYRVRLRAEGLLTRDAREVERKKPGRPKARKRFQFSKR